MFEGKFGPKCHVCQMKNVKKENIHMITVPNVDFIKVAAKMSFGCYWQLVQSLN